MKRYRHYKRDKAIILSCFGSVIEQQIYLDLQRDAQKRFEGVDIFLSFSSRMVLKDLYKRGLEYKNLAQVLADVDMLGYRNIVVASINLFPTDEHELLLRTVRGFKEFSYANIRASKAIINRTEEVSLALKTLNKRVEDDGWTNLYIIHGVPILDLAGLSSVSYTESFLRFLNKNNYTCSLEGAFPYYTIRETLIEKMKDNEVKSLQIVPMLLVSGNHYIKDMVEIKDELGEHFETRMAPSLSKSSRFNLIELDDIREIIFKNIEEEIIKLG